MQKPEIWKLVLAHLAPSKTELSSSDWRSYVSRYIVPEVRQESVRFFGSIDSQEAQYPGLDYANPAHRLRLKSFPNHHKLFIIFDKLRLTEGEINNLCKWHGTKRSREDFEKKHNFQIADTTWEDVHPYQYLEPIITLREGDATAINFQSTNVQNRAVEEDEQMENVHDAGEDVDEGHMTGQESEDEVQHSVGLELNARLRANAEADAEARARGEQVTMDAEWEQWLKEAAERGMPTGIPAADLSAITANATVTTWERELPGIFAPNSLPQNVSLQVQPPALQQLSPSSALPTMLNAHDLEAPRAASDLVLS